MTNDKVDSAQSQLDKINNQIANVQTEQFSAINTLNTITQNEISYLNGPSSTNSASAGQFTPSVSPQQTMPQYQIASNYAETQTSTVSTSIVPSISSRPNPNISIDEIVNNVINQRNQANAANQASTPVNQFTIQNSMLAQNNANTLTVNVAPSIVISNTPSSNKRTVSSSQVPVSSDLGNEFKISSGAGFKSAYVSDSKAFLKNLGIDISSTAPSQTSYLYTFDDASLKSLLVKGSSQARLSSLMSCTDPSLVDSALVQDVGLGYILAKNNSYMYRLTLSECTKLASTATNNSLQVGTRIYFSGVPVVSLPNNILLNAYLVVSIPA